MNHPHTIIVRAAIVDRDVSSETLLTQGPKELNEICDWILEAPDTPSAFIKQTLRTGDTKGIIFKM